MEVSKFWDLQASSLLGLLWTTCQKACSCICKSIVVFVSSARGSAYSMLRQIEWCYSVYIGHCKHLILLAQWTNIRTPLINAQCQSMLINTNKKYVIAQWAVFRINARILIGIDWYWLVSIGIDRHWAMIEGVLQYWTCEEEEKFLIETKLHPMRVKGFKR